MRIALAATALLLLLGLAFAAAMLTVFHGPVTAERLDQSVAGKAGKLTMQDCAHEHGDPRRWRCAVWIDEGRFSSGGVAYDVRVRRDSSCWTATLAPDLAREAGVPARLHGCVHAWQINL